MTAGFMDQQKRFTYYSVFFILFSMVCQTYHPLERIKQGDYSVVVMGKYRGTAIFLRDGAQYKNIIDRIRDEIEKDSHLFPEITRHHYDIPELLVYRFKFAAIDTVEDNFILRYFARIYNHPILAGYQIQFVFDTESLRLVHIYTKEVGLE